ncbi:MAG: MarR family EPS-associated transcriptional regulator [Deltaproteobacteria bacterium HGW-Deltaproteobacteria-10]|nr:MAG: MarR family EPS-associated transcriptional regulator [Deltaproteobacteria bacterium HGW-Deltaproteobacteria-10]
MNPVSEETLMVLKEVSVTPQLSQRELSSRLGFSLGKINFLIKAMIEKGLIKAESFKNSKNKIAYLYVLTPTGIEEKTRTTYHFLKRKIDEYEKLEREIQQLKKEVDCPDIPNEDLDSIL